MNVILLATFLFGQTGQAAAQKSVTFADPQLNLQFDHPADWKIVKPVKKKGLRVLNDRTTFNYMLEGSTIPVTLEVIRTAFNSTVETWQDVQVQANQQLHHDVVRQWQQEILGVPTLFTKASYKVGDDTLNAVTGLFYMRGPRKMLLRLVCEANVYDKAQNQLISAMETLRTIDGTTPAPEDPNRKIDPNEAKSQIISTRPVAITDSAKSETKLPNACAITTANRNYVVRYGRDWKASLKDGSIEFTSAKGDLKVSAEIRSTLDSEAPEAALTKRAVESLAKFDQVALREDKTEKNPYGTSVSYVRRQGSDKKGNLIVQDTVIAGGEVYLVVNWTSRDLANAPKDQLLFRTLTNGVAIEPAK